MCEIVESPPLGLVFPTHTVGLPVYSTQVLKYIPETTLEGISEVSSVVVSHHIRDGDTALKCPCTCMFTSTVAAPLSCGVIRRTPRN